MARILVVDDNSQVRTMIVRFLATTSHAVTEATNGNEALDQIRAESPDLVITDIFMPDRDGFETIIHIKREHPHIAIIAMSAGSRTAPDVAYLNMAQKLGADAILTKPFKGSLLCETVERLLANRGAG